MKDNIRIISAATSNYMLEMKELPESVLRSGFKHTFIRYFNAKIPFKNRQDYLIDGKLWIANVNQKIYHFLHALDCFNEPFIYWTDWDSKINNPEWMIEQAQDWANRGIDVALSEQVRQIRSGIQVNYITGSMFVQNNDRARWFLKHLIREMEYTMPEVVDEQTLNYVMRDENQQHLSHNVIIEKMPPGFIQIFDNRMDGVDPAIIHSVASRTHNKMNTYVSVEKYRDQKHQKDQELMTNNIIESDFQFPTESITIVGAAESAKGLFDRIPEDSYKIACNIAILIPDIKFDAWLCVDHKIPMKPWFDEIDREFMGQKIYRFQEPSEFEKMKEVKHTERLTLGFKGGRFPVADDILQIFCYQSLRDKSIECVKGEFRNGGTVAGFALQLAWYYNVKRVYFIGVHLKGNQYSVDVDKNPHHHSEEVWEERTFLQNLITTCKNEGMGIYALSPTTLNLDYPEWLNHD